VIWLMNEINPICGIAFVIQVIANPRCSPVTIREASIEKFFAYASKRCIAIAQNDSCLFYPEIYIP